MASRPRKPILTRDQVKALRVLAEAIASIPNEPSAEDVVRAFTGDGVPKAAEGMDALMSLGKASGGVATCVTIVGVAVGVSQATDTLRKYAQEAKRVT